MSGVAFENAMEAARQFMSDTAAYRAYLNREMYLHDQASNHAAAFAEGLEEGEKRGLAKGAKKGESRFGALMSKLLSAKRYEDAALASSNEEKREALYMEFGL